MTPAHVISLIRTPIITPLFDMAVTEISDVCQRDLEMKRKIVLDLDDPLDCGSSTI